MTLSELKARALAIVVLSGVVAFIILFASMGEASGLALVVGSVGGLALLTWIAAAVADAAVKSLKKEN